MRFVRTNLIARVAICFSSIFSICVESHAADSPNSKRPPGYPSPQAVFSAFCAATKKQDGLAVFNCFTTKLQTDSVMEAFFTCCVKGSDPKVQAVLKKHGITDDLIQEEYRKRYLKKHNIDIVKLLEERASKEAKLVDEYLKKHGVKNTDKNPVATPSFEEELGPPPPEDRELYCDSIEEIIRDKPGFYDDVSRAIWNPKDPLTAPPVCRELHDLQLQGESATGKFNTILYVVSQSPGKPPKIEADQVEGKIRFQKTKSGWLISEKEL